MYSSKWFWPNLNETWILPDKDLVLTVAVGWHQLACMFRPSEVTHLRQDVNDLTTPASDCYDRRESALLENTWLPVSTDCIGWPVRVFQNLFGKSLFVGWKIQFSRENAPISKGKWQQQLSKTWCIYRQCRPRWQEDHDDEETTRWLSQQPGVQCTLRGGNSNSGDCGKS